MIETERLVLRRWRLEDLKPYAAMMADPDVDYWLGGFSTPQTALAAPVVFEARLEETGFGFLAVERRTNREFLGAAGLMLLEGGEPLSPGIEIGWRFARAAWGFGYASEAAHALLYDGFARLNLSEIVAFTAKINARSRGVMERIGMRRDAARDFNHPKLAADHPLLRHVVYAATSESCKTHFEGKRS